MQTLLKQLRSANYAGWNEPVTLSIHLDGDASAAAVEVAEHFNWTRGALEVNVSAQHRGLRSMWLTTLGAASQEAGKNSLLVVFEDDLRVSSEYFQWRV